MDPGGGDKCPKWVAERDTMKWLPDFALLASTATRFLFPYLQKTSKVGCPLAGRIILTLTLSSPKSTYSCICRHDALFSIAPSGSCRSPLGLGLLSSDVPTTAGLLRGPAQRHGELLHDAPPLVLDVRWGVARLPDAGALACAEKTKKVNVSTENETPKRVLSMHATRLHISKSPTVMVGKVTRNVLWSRRSKISRGALFDLVVPLESTSERLGPERDSSCMIRLIGTNVRCGWYCLSIACESHDAGRATAPPLPASRRLYTHSGARLKLGGCNMCACSASLLLTWRQPDSSWSHTNRTELQENRRFIPWPLLAPWQQRQAHPRR